MRTDVNQSLEVNFVYFVSFQFSNKLMCLLFLFAQQFNGVVGLTSTRISLMLFSDLLNHI